MKSRAIKLPDIGEGVTEAEIVEWHVAIGDQIAEDQSIGTVVTDKAAVEIPSPSSGTVVALCGQIGDVLAVGAELCRIEPIGENAVAGKDGLLEARSPKKSGSSAGDEQTPDERASRRRVPLDQARQASSVDPVVSVSDDVALGAPNDSALMASDDVDSVRSEPVTEPRRKARAAPAVRQRARERCVALQAVPGTGPEGRVTHEDLDRYLAASASHGASTAARPDGSDKVEEISIVGLRRQIARHMQLSSRSIPHFSYIEELDVTVLEALRAAPGGRGDSSNRGHAIGLSPLPFIVMAIVRALDEFPDMNARYDDEAEIVSRHAARHVGIATRTDAGLVVPVIRHAEALDIRALAAEIARLAEAARSGRATREELTGGTITVSSLGALGGIVSTPIINHPEVAIVGVNRIVERPACHEGRIEVRRMMNLSASFDHRVVDGHDAARFVQRIRAYLEHPGVLLVPD